METVEILRKAKAELERRGFCQGDFTNEQGCCCILGACWFALGAEFRKVGQVWRVRNSDATQSMPGDLLQVLDTATGSRASHEWNDAPGRTKEEVLAALDRAIALASPPPGSQPPGSKEGA